MERRVVSRHGPDCGQKAHNGRPANRPFGSVLKRRPDLVAVVCLWMVDRPSREPDDENDDDNDVENRPDLVDPADEPGRLHRDHALDDQKQEQGQINVPRLRDIIRIRNFSAGDQHGRQGVIDGARGGDEATKVGPSDKPSGQRTITFRGQHSRGVVQPARGGHAGAEFRHGQCCSLDNGGRHQPSPYGPSGPRIP